MVNCQLSIVNFMRETEEWRRKTPGRCCPPAVHRPGKAGLPPAMNHFFAGDVFAPSSFNDSFCDSRSISSQRAWDRVWALSRLTWLAVTGGGGGGAGAGCVRHALVISAW